MLRLEIEFSEFIIVWEEREFHEAEQARSETKINDPVLSGGVFQNVILLELMENELLLKGFNVYSHSKIPTNDGGISFGQVMVVNELIIKGMSRVEFVL